MTETETSVSTRKPQAPTAASGPVLVLNVDDTEALRYAKTRILLQAGYEVVEASSGMAALELAAQRRPSLVLLDVKLPDISGIEVCQRLKELNPSLVVLQTSASFVTGADRVAGFDSGADGYLVQPLEPDELLASIRALLRMRAAEEGLRQANELLEQRVAQRTDELHIRSAQLEESYRQLRHEIDEREKAEAALRQSQKMEALGRLTGGIAHDFNNLLGAISGSLQLIKKRLKKGNYDIERYVEAAMTGTSRAAKLTSRLLAFSRQQTLKLDAVDLHELITGLTDLLKRTLGEQITIEIALKAASPWVRSDENQLENALLNMAINSRDAMPDGGTFRIETGEEVLPRPGLVALSHLAPGRYVTLAAIDTGIGMPQAVMERAMEPFFTTKPIGKGTGLGLSMIYGLMSQSGGGVVLESEEGKGTVVKLYMATTVAKELLEEGEMDEAAEQGKQAARILIAEDEELIRMMMVEVLQDEHFDVLDAGNGEMALQHLSANRDIDLLIADVGLPGLNGRQLVEKARETNPHLKAIFVTGYSRDILQNQGTGNESDEWIKSITVLRKPFDLTELIDKVRSVLAEPEK
ncbi:MAG TPA: response regulator [Terriglobia bacterium]|nr:response regulator [Terriglobia bacterium]